MKYVKLSQIWVHMLITKCYKPIHYWRVSATRKLCGMITHQGSENLLNCNSKIEGCVANRILTYLLEKIRVTKQT